MKKPQYTIGEYEGEEDPYFFQESSPDINFKDAINIEGSFNKKSAPPVEDTTERFKNLFIPQVQDNSARIFDGDREKVEEAPSTDAAPPTEEEFQMEAPPKVQETASPTPKATNTDPDSKGFSWGDIIGRLASGLTPMALEGLFGGGEHYGQAAEGGLAGMKAYNEIDNEFYKRNKENKLLEMKQNQRSAASRDSYDLVEAKDKDGNPVMVLKNKATGSLAPTEYSPYDKPSSTNIKPYSYEAYIIDEKTGAKGKDLVTVTGLTYPDGTVKEVWGGKDVTGKTIRPDKVNPYTAGAMQLRKDQFEAKQRGELQKDLEGKLGMHYNLNEYANKYRNLESLSPKWAKVPDSNLPENLKLERNAVRGILVDKVREIAGASQTQQEFTNSMAKFGFSGIPMSWGDALTRPAMIADMLTAKVSPDVIRAALDRETHKMNLQMRNIEQGVLPDTSKKYFKDIGVNPQISIPKTTPSESTISTTTQAEAILKNIKRKRGLE